MTLWGDSEKPEISMKLFISLKLGSQKLHKRKLHYISTTNAASNHGSTNYGSHFTTPTFHFRHCKMLPKIHLHNNTNNHTLPLPVISSLFARDPHWFRNLSTSSRSRWVADGSGGGPAKIRVSLVNWASRPFSWANAIANRSSLSFWRSISERSKKIKYEVFKKFIVLKILIQ